MRAPPEGCSGGLGRLALRPLHGAEQDSAAGERVARRGAGNPNAAGAKSGKDGAQEEFVTQRNGLSAVPSWEVVRRETLALPSHLPSLPLLIPWQSSHLP